MIILSIIVLIKDQIRYLIQYLKIKTDYQYNIIAQTDFTIVILNINTIVNNLKI